MRVTMSMSLLNICLLAAVCLAAGAFIAFVLRGDYWRRVKDKLPKPETEVLAVCVRNGYRFICPVIFEDGTMLTQNSMWNWYELGNYGTYSEENDDYFVPEGWWENRQFTPDDIYNNPVDCTVTHWMPLPKKPMSERGNLICTYIHYI